MIDEGATAGVCFGDARRPPRSQVDARLRAAVRNLRSEVAEALGVSIDDLPPADSRRMYLASTLRELSSLCIGRASVWAATGEGHVASVLRLALDLGDLATEVEEDELAERQHRFGACADALTRLRGVATASEVLETAVRELVTRCGFGRVVVSAVDTFDWIPLAAHFADDDHTWFEDFAGKPIPLHGTTPEARMLTKGLPMLVEDTARGAIHREIVIEAGRSSSYVGAPVVVDGTTVGFLHADHFPEQRLADHADRDILSLFANGLGRIHERLVLAERVQEQRTRVDAVVGNAIRAIDDAGDAVASTLGGQLVAPRQDLVTALTPREHEVVRLMVAGATNYEIARRLAISPDTVKSHVTQILRKFGVTNRAQVIACAAGTALA